MAKKICLISDLHLSSNPRLWKEACSLAKAGNEIVILTMWTSAEKKMKDLLLIRQSNIEYKAAINLIPGEIHFLRRFYLRLHSRISREIKRWLNKDSVWCLGYAPKSMIRHALQENADLYIAHTEYGLAIGKDLLNKGGKVAFDIEDWYSNDYLVPERPVVLLRNLEKVALEKGVYCSCPSQSMATALQKAYPEGKPIQVIYNGFSQSENVLKAVQLTGMPSLVWFSQTIGPGRGLETIIQALTHLKTKVELHLIGECSEAYKQKLNDLFPFSSGHKIKIHAAVKHHELTSILSRHNIGLAIENIAPENKNTTISNKILQYIQAGNKVLATETAGQKEVAEYFKNAISIVPVDAPEYWAEIIEKLLSSPAIDREKQLQQFNTVFSWEAQEQKLLQLVGNAIDQ